MTWLFYFMFFEYGTRSIMVQSYINMKKRTMGEPVEGTVTIVITRIEFYDMLMEDAPEAMDQAVNLVGNLIRKAVNLVGNLIKKVGV
eukprot:gene3420-13465_t